MSKTPPTLELVWQAIVIYLRCAWPEGPSPRVLAILDALRVEPDESFFEHPCWERTLKPTQRYALRLGNSLYPHMKLVIEEAPSGSVFLFRADGHTTHVQHGVSPDEAEAFRSLVSVNRILSNAIETAWDAAAIPTFKRFLRDDIARRRALRPVT